MVFYMAQEFFKEFSNSAYLQLDSEKLLSQRMLAVFAMAKKKLHGFKKNKEMVRWIQNSYNLPTCLRTAGVIPSHNLVIPSSVAMK